MKSFVFCRSHNPRLYLIIIIYFIPYYLFSQNSVFEKFSFDQMLPGDTLMIKSDLYCSDDNGSFETIYIFSSFGICASLKRDKPSSIEFKYLDPNKPFAQLIELNEENKKIIEVYVQDLVRYKNDPHWLCHGSRLHILKFRNNSFCFTNIDCTWDRYIPLRDKLFKTAPYEKE